MYKLSLKINKTKPKTKRLNLQREFWSTPCYCGHNIIYQVLGVSSIWI